MHECLIIANNTRMINYCHECTNSYSIRAFVAKNFIRAFVAN